jgi:chromate transporter
LALLLHFAGISLLAVGGAISTAPESHRFLVNDHRWLTDSQFSASIALAQAAPGPNVLYIALLGWNVGLNAGGGLSAGLHGWAFALLGMLICMAGILVPSSTLTFLATRWSHNNRELRAVKAFKQGLAPIVVGLLMATGWLLSAMHSNPATDWRLWLLTAISAVLVWRTKLHLLWLLGAGALAGALGWV